MGRIHHNQTRLVTRCEQDDWESTSIHRDSQDNILELSRSATLVVAANDSPAKSKAGADYVCDGTADDVEIQAAIDALSGNAGSIMLLEGTFNISTTLDLNNTPVKLCGQGINRTILQLANSANTKLLVDNDAITGVEICGIDFNGNGANQSDAASRAERNLVEFDYKTDSQIHHCRFRNTRHGGALSFQYGARVNIHHNHFVNNNVSGVHNCDHLFTGINNNIIIQSNHFDTCTDVAIASDNNREVVISNNVIDGCARGSISHWNADDDLQTPTRSIIQGNWIRGDCLYGIIIGRASGESKVAERVIVTGNYIEAHTTAGNVGIDWRDGAYNGVITGNFIYADTGCIGIYIAGSTLFVTDNLFSGAGDGIETIAGSDYVYVFDNYFQGGTIVETVAPSNKKYRGNLGYTTENSGTATLANGNTSIAVNHGLDVIPAAGDIVVTPIEAWGAMTQFYIDTYTSTQFTIHADQDPGQDVDFAWKAIVL